jgi:hypothetical protein
MTQFSKPMLLMLLTALVLGCATVDTESTIQVREAKSLSGKWLGYAIGTGAGAPQVIELTINPDGTYVSRIGAQVQSGTVRVSNGKVSFTRDAASATSTTVMAASTAVLQEREGRRVLVGQGRSDYGPYSYEFTEQR